MLVTRRPDGSFTLGDEHGDFVDSEPDHPMHVYLPEYHCRKHSERTEPGNKLVHYKGTVPMLRELVEKYGIVSVSRKTAITTAQLSNMLKRKSQTCRKKYVDEIKAAYKEMIENA